MVQTRKQRIELERSVISAETKWAIATFGHQAIKFNRETGEAWELYRSKEGEGLWSWRPIADDQF